MKLRSLLLGVCMVVVPALALFSHHVPPSVTAAMRSLAAGRLPAWLRASSSAPVPAGPGSAAVEAAVPSTPAILATAAHGPDPLPPATQASPAMTAMTPTPLPTSTQASPPPAGRRAVEDRLLELGATAIECQPAPGGGGTLLASCRVAADPSGQLQRLFQATGPDPTAALESLRADVAAWRRRIAAEPPAVTR